MPSGYQEGDNLPLVIVFHGFGGCGLHGRRNEWFERFGGRRELLCGLPSSGVQTCEGRHLLGARLQRWTTSEQLIEHIDEEFSLDLSRVYAAGYSNGGMLTYSLACLRGDLFAGVCVMSGALLDAMDSCDPAQPVPMIIFHGTGDFVLPYNGDQYYASVDVVSLWVDHFQIPASTLTSTDLNGGNVVHDSYFGGTNNIFVHGD